MAIPVVAVALVLFVILAGTAVGAVARKFFWQRLSARIGVIGNIGARLKREQVEGASASAQTKTRTQSSKKYEAKEEEDEGKAGHI